MTQQEQGCRAGRRPFEERLAQRDRDRHQERARQMKDVGNWPTGQK